jgi:hypothetical protein
LVFSGVADIPTDLLQVYPVPMNKELCLNNPQSKSMPVVVRDMQGRLIYQGMLTSGKNTLDVSSWAHGAYLLQLEYQGTRYGKQLLK